MRILNRFWKTDIEILQKTNLTNTWRSRKGWPINIGRHIGGAEETDTLGGLESQIS